MNIVNVIIAWLVPSFSECVQPHTTLLLPFFVPHYGKGDVYASHCEQQQTHGTNPLRSVVFERVLNNLWFPYVSGYTLTTILQARPFSSVKAHPHPIHIIFWSIFFGPIIILMPCLLVLEIIILFLFHLNFITHGLLPGT